MNTFRSQFVCARCHCYSILVIAVLPKCVLSLYITFICITSTFDIKSKSYKDYKDRSECECECSMNGVILMLCQWMCVWMPIFEHFNSQHHAIYASYKRQTKCRLSASVRTNDQLIRRIIIFFHDSGERFKHFNNYLLYTSMITLIRCIQVLFIALYFLYCFSRLLIAL